MSIGEEILHKRNYNLSWLWCLLACILQLLHLFAAVCVLLLFSAIADVFLLLEVVADSLLPLLV